MLINCPIGDMLTRIRNALARFYEKVNCPYSKFRWEVLKVMLDEGYVLDFSKIEVNNKPTIEIKLKYHKDTSVIDSLKLISKPGCRVYVNRNNIPRVYNGLGIAVLSTSKGVLSDKQARDLGVGGELLCEMV